MANRPQSIVQLTVAESGVGYHNLVAVPAEYELVILALALSASGTVQITLQDETTSLADLYFGNQVPHNWPYNEKGWKRTGENQNFGISILGGGVNVAGIIVYQLVPSHLQL